jgi:GAF domain-containing protein
MQEAPVLANEQQRLDSVQALGLLDTPPEERFDSITQEAVDYFKVAISTITLIDRDREWYKSFCGSNKLSCERKISFCGHAMYSKFIFVVEDTLQDDRFKDNPMVVGEPYIRFYAGIALYNRNTKLPVGAFCIKDTKPRQMSVDDLNYLMVLGEKAEAELNKNI